LDQCEERREIILQGNQTLVFNGGGGAWRVESGSVAVFAVELQDGCPRGRRRHLFDVLAGEILLEMKSPAEARHGLIAGPVQPAVLASVESAELARTSWGRAALETWSGKLDSVLASLAGISDQPSAETSLDAAGKGARATWHTLSLHDRVD